MFASLSSAPELSKLQLMESNPWYERHTNHNNKHSNGSNRVDRKSSDTSSSSSSSSNTGETMTGYYNVAQPNRRGLVLHGVPEANPHGDSVVIEVNKEAPYIGKVQLC